METEISPSRDLCYEPHWFLNTNQMAHGFYSPTITSAGSGDRRNTVSAFLVFSVKIILIEN
jgi:hypothetical protein